MTATYRRVHLIYNPTAGRLQGKGAAAIPLVTRALAAQGSEVTCAPTSGSGEATELARRGVSSEADLVLVAGGDGTVNEVVNGLVHSRVPMGVLAFGTANVLATEMGLSRRVETAVEQVPALVEERISVGLLRAHEAPPRYFLLMAGAGLDAHIVSIVDPELKEKLGKLAYWIGGFGQLARRIPQFDVASDDHAGRGGFALASRVRNYGGDLEIARTASLLDDYFELVVFEGEHPARYLKYFTGVLTRSLPKMKGVSVVRAHRVRFSAAPEMQIPIQVDGEAAGQLPATIEIVPDALTLLAPPSLRQKYSKKPGD